MFLIRGCFVQICKYVIRLCSYQTLQSVTAKKGHQHLSLEDVLHGHCGYASSLSLYQRQHSMTSDSDLLFYHKIVTVQIL